MRQRALHGPMNAAGEGVDEVAMPDGSRIAVFVRRTVPRSGVNGTRWTFNGQRVTYGDLLHLLEAKRDND